LALTVGKEWRGLGASFLDHTIAYEALGEGCPSTGRRRAAQRDPSGSLDRHCFWVVEAEYHLAVVLLIRSIINMDKKYGP
jgi:hypothetical protein